MQQPPQPPALRRGYGGDPDHGFDPDLEALLRYTCIALALLLLAWMLHAAKRRGLGLYLPGQARP